MSTTATPPGTAPAWARTRVAQRLGLTYPIIQGPLGGTASQRLAAAVSNRGGLGSFGAHGLAPGPISEVIGEIRSLTERPFAINLWVSMEDAGARASDEAAFERSLRGIEPLLRSLGAAVPAYAPYAPVSFEAQARAVIDARVPVFSFIFGVPAREILDECRARGIVTVGAATTPDEAVELERAGVDVIAACGFEGGGHRGSFLRPSEDSLTGTLSLVPQIVDRVSTPVVAAGGIADSRGIVAALALGAEGVQIGTAFLACEESGASDLHRHALLSGAAGHTALTRAVTGRLARAIKNGAIDALNAPGVDVLPYPLQRFLVRNLTGAAERAARPDLVPMWAGQSANLARHTSAGTLFDELVSGVSDVVESLARAIGRV